ncbi:MAG TPA: DMT family transporter [Flavitalea sp.]|nr:DMT family transporter [Flavitalea sp.]
MKLLYYILPLLAGIMMTVQSGINSQLRSAIQHPLLAALISFLSGTAALIVLVMLSKQAMPTMQTFSSISWYKWTGGLLGAFIVTVSLVSVARIGAANMFVLIIAGQLLTALIIDHFGMLGLQQSTITLQKTIGVLLLVGGVYLVTKK